MASAGLILAGLGLLIVLIGGVVAFFAGPIIPIYPFLGAPINLAEYLGMALAVIGLIIAFLED